MRWLLLAIAAALRGAPGILVPPPSRKAVSFFQLEGEQADRGALCSGVLPEYLEEDGKHGPARLEEVGSSRNAVREAEGVEAEAAESEADAFSRPVRWKKPTPEPVETLRQQEDQGIAGQPDWWSLPHGRRTCPSTIAPMWKLRPLLIPEKKLAFCYISKNACTQFKDLVNILNGFDSHELRGFGHDYFKSTTNTFMNIDMRKVNKENGWKFAVFLRDPALRYLSAFSFACTRDSVGELEAPGVCCGQEGDWEKHGTDLITLFEERVASDVEAGLPWGEMHWASQTEFIRQCGMDNFHPSKADFVGFVDGNMNSQVKAMLRKADIRRDKLVDEFFPLHGVAGHHSSRAISPKAFYRNASTMKSVRALYKEDYELHSRIGCSWRDQRHNPREEEDDSTAPI